jgi:lysine-specific demethylase/histidyl-hydroxylase NO66
MRRSTCQRPSAGYRASPPLAGALARRFAAPANLQLFLARAGAGLRPHSDIHDSFILQIAGRKRWQVEDVDAAAPRPLGNAGGAFGAAARTIELEPGDVLYKPSHGSTRPRA